MKKENKEKKQNIIPNTVYTINRLNFATQANVLAKVCMTLRFAKREPVDPDIFMDYITKALAFGRCIIFVTFDKEMELNGCLVMLLNDNPFKGKILFIEWAWGNSKSLELSKKVFEKIEDLAQRLGAKKIACAITRGYKAIEKRYGFKEAYRVMEKEVK